MSTTLTAELSSFEMYSCVPSWLISKFSGSDPPLMVRTTFWRDVEYADSIGAFVRRRKRALVDVRTRDGRSAQRRRRSSCRQDWGWMPRGRFPSGTVAITF